MKVKSGKSLTQLEIIKRLKLMGIKYDSTIIGKSYYINLYNKEVELPSNQEKIKKELEKDQKYQEYLTNNLRIKKQTLIEYMPIKKCWLNENQHKSYFFDEFQTLYSRILFSYNALYFVEINKNKIDEKIMILLNSLKRIAKAFTHPEFCKLFKAFWNYVDKINLDAYHYIYIIIFICLLIILLFLLIKSQKKKIHFERKKI